MSTWIATFEMFLHGVWTPMNEHIAPFWITFWSVVTARIHLVVCTIYVPIEAHHAGADPWVHIYLFLHFLHPKWSFLAENAPQVVNYT